MNSNAAIMLALERAIDKGLNFLSGEQLPSGEFNSYRSTDPLMESDCVSDSSPFPNALIAFSLSFSNSAIARKMIDLGSGFLLSEMEKHGVWRYWTSKHPYHTSIPPDLDDIACISSVLQQNNTPYSKNEQLLLANRNSKGLFYTWIVPRIKLPKSLSHMRVVFKEAIKPLQLYYFWKYNESEPNDIDAVVNSNVLYYLGHRKETAPVIDYLIDIIKNNKEEGCDKWHLSPFNLQYFVSKNYYAGITALESVRELSIEKLIDNTRRLSEDDDNVLSTALAGCALLNWNCQTDLVYPNIVKIINSQDESGSWPIFPLYYGGPRKYFGWGSREITTAYCVEALTRYLKATTAYGNDSSRQS